MEEKTKQTIVFSPIGIIRTPFGGNEKLPRQGRFGENNDGRVEIFPEFAEGLKDIEGFSHIYLLFYFHLSEGYKLIQRTPLNHNLRGVFAIRSPHRPNGIGQTIVKLIRREENILFISGVDMIDRTPLLDVKPYISDIDSYADATKGWLTHRK